LFAARATGPARPALAVFARAPDVGPDRGRPLLRAGGLSQGLTDDGFRVRQLPTMIRTPARHIGSTFRVVFVEGDLTNTARHGELVGQFDGEQLDLLAGGPPCQAYSQVRNDDRLIEDNQKYRRVQGAAKCGGDGRYEAASLREVRDASLLA
jgi:hypothetical protein